MNKYRPEIRAKQMWTNPSYEQLRQWASHEERTTQYGSASYVTKVRNRSAKLTYIIEDGVKLGVKQSPISPARALEIISQVVDYLKDREVICLDRTLGQNPQSQLACRLYITKEYARIPFMWYNSLFPPLPGKEPDLISVYVPEWPERIIFTNPEAGVTYILGTDYFGECKKSFLRMAMYVAKKRGWLGFHAGSKLLRIKNSAGQLEDVGFIMFGLSGTGKTTLTIHNHGLSGEEGVVIRQDDVVLMNEAGFCYGTENGFYIKTEGLDESQKVLYEAATSPTAIFENVKVEPDGRIDFANSELTSNGRGMLLRSSVKNTDDTIDLPKAHKIIFITRRKDTVPVVAKLNPAQAAAFFMLGESIETSAGDPTKAGQSKREVGTNPFIVGPEFEEGNRFLSILKANPDIECFLLNTGSVGAKDGFEGEKITIKVSTEIMKQIAKGGIYWQTDPDWGYLVPSAVAGLDLTKYDPRQYYSEAEYQELVNNLRRERIEWLAQFPGLEPEIVAAIKK